MNGEKRLRLQRWQIAFLSAMASFCVSFATGAQDPEDFAGYWHGRMTGNAVNVAVHIDRWLENGTLKGVMTVVPFLVAYEEITFNSDATLSIALPSTLGVFESTITISVTSPAQTNVEKTTRSAWTRAGGIQGGAGEFTWDDPSMTKASTDAELTGRYEGILWPGVAANERIQARMEIQVSGNVVTGKIMLPVEEVKVIKGHRFHNRVILEVRGKTMFGLWAGSATPEGIQFHWDMGVGYGQAEFKKTESNSGGSEEVD